MNTAKKLMTLLLALLALTACHDSKDEPAGQQDYGILMATHGLRGDLIYNIQGDTVYEGETWWAIPFIESEGKDWYAAIIRDDENNHRCYTIIKNGGPAIFSTYDNVSSMKIDHGDIYLMQFNEQHPNQIWITKNSRLIYTVEYNDVFIPQWMRVKDGDVVLTGPARSSRACYWKNGKLIDIPGVEGPMELGCYVAWEGNNELIGFSMDKNGHAGYLLNGERNDLDLERVHHVEFINGKPVIVGQKFVKGMGSVAVTVIDGDEHVLNPDYLYNGSYVKKMEKRGNSAFYYVASAKNSMYVFGIYKDLIPIDLPDEVSKKGIIDVTFPER